MKNRYRIQNRSGQVLSHVDTAQQAADVVCNLGADLCEQYYSEDLRPGCTFPFTTYSACNHGFVGVQHEDRPI